MSFRSTIRGAQMVEAESAPIRRLRLDSDAWPEDRPYCVGWRIDDRVVPHSFWKDGAFGARHAQRQLIETGGMEASPVSVFKKVDGVIKHVSFLL